MQHEKLQKDSLEQIFKDYFKDSLTDEELQKYLAMIDVDRNGSFDYKKFLQDTLNLMNNKWLFPNLYYKFDE